MSGVQVKVHVPVGTLYITHIYDGEEVVSGGRDGQAYVATFADIGEARQFVEYCLRTRESVAAERPE